ncbi:hypothetical protein EBR57_00560 [bacterium]|nr:hypothetical protein [bacterium]
MTAILCPIRCAAIEYETIPAIVTESTAWTYLEIDNLVTTITQNLINFGIKEGNRVAFVAIPTVESIALLFALFRVGAIGVPLYPKDPSTQHYRIAEDVDVSALIWDGPILDTSRQIISLKMLTTAVKITRNEPVLACDQPCVMVRTSGTQGSPKFAVLSIGNLYYSALGVLDRIPLSPAQRWLLSVPIHHVSGIGILVRTFISSATVALPSASETILENAYRLSPSHLSVVPTQLNRILNDPSFKNHQWGWQTVMVSGAPMMGVTYDHVMATGLPIMSAYGLTEMSSAVTLGQPMFRNDGGKILPFRDLRIGPNDEIQVRGKTLFLGYWLPSGYMSLPLTADGWFSTGDTGRFDNGGVEIRGRLDDIIISGGENIHPSEIESAIGACFPQEKILVFGIPNPEFGERPIVALGEPVPLATLHAALSNMLPSFKYPDRVIDWQPEWDQWPKISRKKVAQWVCEGRS